MRVWHVMVTLRRWRLLMMRHAQTHNSHVFNSRMLYLLLDLQHQSIRYCAAKFQKISHMLVIDKVIDK